MINLRYRDYVTLPIWTQVGKIHLTFFEKKVSKKALLFSLRWACGSALARLPLFKFQSRGIPTSNPNSTILDYQNGTIEALVAARYLRSLGL